MYEWATDAGGAHQEFQHRPDPKIQDVSLPLDVQPAVNGRACLSLYRRMKMGRDSAEGHASALPGSRDSPPSFKKR